MRLVLDIMGATALSGGMRLHATEVIHAWTKTYPDDELIILGPEWAKTEFSGSAGKVRIVTWPNEKAPFRFLGQVFVAPLVRYVTNADFLVSLSPIVSPLGPRGRGVCFQHDWRHVKNPNEFSWLQKFYRKLWNISASRALTNACISNKTRSETLSIVPGARTLLVPNGADHPARWSSDGQVSQPELSGSIVTFGHHNNKRPELVMSGFARLKENEPSRSDRLVVLGARGRYQESLQELATDLGIGSQIKFPGFVSDSNYQQIISASRCIVLASSDEGYGLPVAEADYFGVPAIVTSDSGLDGIFDDLVVAEPTADSMEEALKRALSTEGNLKEKTLPTWADTVVVLRTFLSASMP